MRRVQFIEIHDQAWFPSSFRDGVTGALQFGFNLSNAYAPVAPLLQSALQSAGNQSNGCQSVVDLCSGGGGPWLELSRTLRARTVPGELPALQIWLTDKYPNIGAIQSTTTVSGNHIGLHAASVDAMNVPRELKGFRTMFTSFHHFPPEEARAILQNAVDAGEGIGVFEITRRAPSTIALVLAWALVISICTPWVRPLRWSRLPWTFLIPIIPLVLLFDGVISCLRTYRPPELQEIVAKVTGREYQWEIGEVSTGRTPITYLIGYPREANK